MADNVQPDPGEERETSSSGLLLSTDPLQEAIGYRLSADDDNADNGDSDNGDSDNGDSDNGDASVSTPGGPGAPLVIEAGDVSDDDDSDNGDSDNGDSDS